MPFSKQGEDPLDHRRCNRVRFESVEPLSQRTLLWVRVLPGVRKAVAVGRAAAEVTVAIPSEDRHPFADPRPNKGALLLRGAAEHPKEHLRRG